MRSSRPDGGVAQWTSRPPQEREDPGIARHGAMQFFIVRLHKLSSTILVGLLTVVHRSLVNVVDILVLAQESLEMVVV
jgi:hypothetical protein